LKVNSLHHLFGHVNLDSIRRTATFYGIKCVGDITPCADCALAKIKQKSVPKTASSHGNSPGYRLFVVISFSLDSSYGGSCYWVLIVDDFSCCHWNYFLRAKSGLGAVMVVFLQQLKTLHQIDFAFICLDNSGEYIAMASLIRSHGFFVSRLSISVLDRLNIMMFFRHPLRYGSFDVECGQSPYLFTSWCLA
jgi:hypothetical protein